MSSKACTQTSAPSIVRLDTALKLAEKWVSNMSKPAVNGQVEQEPEGRPQRLGLGATAPLPQSKAAPSDDQVGRKLLTLLDAGKRKAVKVTTHEYDGDGDDGDDESDSRNRLFGKKRSAHPAPSLVSTLKKPK